MRKVIIDTDIGSDIDDAICLAYLLAEPQCELLGITTVQGYVHERAKLASALVYQSGKDIPVFEGTSRPMLGKGLPMEVPQAKALDKWFHYKEFKRDWLEFMRDTIRSNPNEITLLAIGPMTNIGILFAYDPELPSLLKELVLMCGAFYGDFQRHKRPEWNAKGDPCATAIVYNAAAQSHRSVGLDVTLQVYMDSKEAREMFKGRLLTPVLDMAEVWFEKRDRLIFHDPLAAVSIFHPDVVEFEKGNVTVDINSGYTEFNPDPNGKVEVANKVYPAKVLNYYFDVFK